MNEFPEKRPHFETERFSVVPLSPIEARNLLSVLLQDEGLASRVPWLMEKSQDGALREAFCIELLSRQIKVWGIDVEVLVASQLWDDGIADEVGDPVVE